MKRRVGVGVREEAEERLSQHGQVGGVEEQLHSRGVHSESVFEEEPHCHPRQTPHSLHPIPHPQHYLPILLLLLLLLHFSLSLFLLFDFSSNKQHRKKKKKKNLERRRETSREEHRNK